MNQRRGHEDELAAEVDVQLFGLAQVVQVLPRDARDRDVRDVDLLPPDEAEQQVKRTLELVEADVENTGGAIRFGRRLFRLRAAGFGVRGRSGGIVHGTGGEPWAER